MNNKDNKSNSKEKSIIESIEDQFDELFAPKKKDEVADTSEKPVVPNAPPVKKVPAKDTQQKPINKKVTPNKAPVPPKKTTTQNKSTGKATQQKTTHNKTLIEKRITSIPEDNIKAPVKQTGPVAEKEVSSDNTDITTVENVFKKANEEHKKIGLLAKAKKGLNPFIFVILILLLVLLAMFNGAIMDSDAIKFFKVKNSSKSTQKTDFISPINKRKVNVSKKIKAPDAKKVIKDSNTEKLDIQEPGTIKQKELVQTNTNATLLPETSDKPVDVVKEVIFSYPYSVYVGSYNSIEKIKAASSVYSEMGITSYWVKLDLGEKGVWFRYFIGYFQTREEADEFIKARQIKDAESRLIKYTNLIGVYRSKEDTDRQKARLEEYGYSPYIISDSENVYRLYIGAFYQKDRAEELKNDLELNNIISEIVER